MIEMILRVDFEGFSMADFWHCRSLHFTTSADFAPRADCGSKIGAAQGYVCVDFFARRASVNREQQWLARDREGKELQRLKPD
ncbi:MAG: hypothetical protein WB780_11960 [Candidatus Acidiferrales bacterium]